MQGKSKKLQKVQVKQNLKTEYSSLLHSFAPIFYLTKLFCLYPYDFFEFKKYRVLQKSKIGTWIVIVGIFIVTANFLLMIYFFGYDVFKTGDSLSMLLGIVLTNFSVVLLIVDICCMLCNQSKFIELFESIQILDDELQQQAIKLDNCKITLRLKIMIVLAVIFECTIFGTTFVQLVDHQALISYLWIFVNGTTFYNTLDKIWFLGLLMSLRERFEAINVVLEQLVNEHDKVKSSKFNESLANVTMLNVQLMTMRPSTKNKIAPIAEFLSDGLGEPSGNPPTYEDTQNEPTINYETELNDAEAMEKKLSRLCQLHDTICTLAAALNKLWSYQILMLMAYGFVIFTAQLYYTYCATQDQFIPSLFRSAKVVYITVIYLFYITGKCVSLMYYSWKISQEAKRTGICLHKCGVAANTNEIYEIVNHLSLKLLNHDVNFSACGFFTLDMETLFAFCGAITSYLIIFIQFNMAGEQAKQAIISAASIPATVIQNNTAANMLMDMRNVSNYFEYILFYSNVL